MPNNGSRIAAWLIDWIIGGILSGLPALITYSLVSGKAAAFPNLYIFEAMGKGPYYALAVGTLCLLIAFIYYVIVPWKITPGQTLGKKWLHLEIRSISGEKLTFKDYFLRQFVMLFLVEGIATTAGSYITPMITTIIRFYLDSYLLIAWTLITFLSFMFMMSKNKALHDYLVKTEVVVKK